MWEGCKEVGGEDERGQDEKGKGHAVIRCRDHWRSQERKEHVTDRIHSTKNNRKHGSIYIQATMIVKSRKWPYIVRRVFIPGRQRTQRLCLDVSRVRAFFQFNLSLLLNEVAGDTEAGYTAVANATAFDLVPVADVSTVGALAGEEGVNKGFVRDCAWSDHLT